MRISPSSSFWWRVHLVRCWWTSNNRFFSLILCKWHVSCAVVRFFFSLAKLEELTYLLVPLLCVGNQPWCCKWLKNCGSKTCFFFQSFWQKEDMVSGTFNTPIFSRCILSFDYRQSNLVTNLLSFYQETILLNRFWVRCVEASLVAELGHF